MKNLLICAMFLMASFASVVMAQTPDELNASKERYAKLEKLSGKAPKASNLQSVDVLALGSTAVMLESLQITPVLEGLYYRSIGQTKEGVTDVTVKKPTLDECMELSVRIARQALAVKTTAEHIQKASEEVKGLKNPMTAGKVVKSLDYSKDALGIVGLESVYQLKAIETIITTIKSAGNL